MKKISFLFIVASFALTSVHAQQKKKDISSTTIKARSNKQILKDQPLSKKLNKPASKSGSEKMLNPQPLPPKEDKGFKEKKSGSEKMLNPQPLPPKERKDFKTEKKGRRKNAKPSTVATQRAQPF